jgi:hypothetical protein
MRRPAIPLCPLSGISRNSSHRILQGAEAPCGATYGRLMHEGTGHTTSAF